MEPSYFPVGERSIRMTGPVKLTVAGGRLGRREGSQGSHAAARRHINGHRRRAHLSSERFGPPGIGHMSGQDDVGTENIVSCGTRENGPPKAELLETLWPPSNQCVSKTPCTVIPGTCARSQPARAQQARREPSGTQPLFFFLFFFFW